MRIPNCLCLAPLLAALAIPGLCACSDDDDDGGGSSGESCSTECPNGASDCPNIVCDCPDGPVNTKACINGCCADKETACEGACD